MKVEISEWGDPGNTEYGKEVVVTLDNDGITISMGAGTVEEDITYYTYDDLGLIVTEKTNGEER